MSDDEAFVNNQTHTESLSQRPQFTSMPLQLNNPSQVSSNIARMVTNMIPQIEQEINAQIVDASGTGSVGQSNNPFIAQGRPRSTQQGSGRAHNSLHGHSRSLSHGQALYHQFNDVLARHAPGARSFPAAYEPGTAAPAVNQSQTPAQTSHAVAANQQQDNSQMANHNFVIDFGGDDGATVNQASIQDNNNNGRRTASPNNNNPLSQLRQMWKHSEGSIPFVILLLVKILYDHRLGKVLL